MRGSSGRAILVVSLRKPAPAISETAKLQDRLLGVDGSRLRRRLCFGSWRRLHALSAKLRLHAVGYPVGVFRLKDRESDHRDREKHGQDHKSEAPFLEKTVLLVARAKPGMHGCLHKVDVFMPV